MHYFFRFPCASVRTYWLASGRISDGCSEVFFIRGNENERRVDFTCNSTDVSWDLIKAFVTAMLDATKRGFAGKFEAVVFHGPTETAGL